MRMLHTCFSTSLPINGTSKLSSQVDFCSKPRMNQKTPRAAVTTHDVRESVRVGSKISEEKDLIPGGTSIFPNKTHFPHLDVGHVHGAFPTSATWEPKKTHTGGGGEPNTDVADDVVELN